MNDMKLKTIMLMLTMVAAIGAWANPKLYIQSPNGEDIHIWTWDGYVGYGADGKAYTGNYDTAIKKTGTKMWCPETQSIWYETTFEGTTNKDQTTFLIKTDSKGQLESYTFQFNGDNDKLYLNWDGKTTGKAATRTAPGTMEVYTGQTATMTYRIYLYCNDNNKTGIYTFTTGDEFPADGGWDDSSIWFTNYEMINGQKWYYKDFTNSTLNLIFRCKGGHKHPYNEPGGVPFSELMKHKDVASSTDSRYVYYAKLNGNDLQYTTRGEIAPIAFYSGATINGVSANEWGAATDKPDVLKFKHIGSSDSGNDYKLIILNTSAEAWFRIGAYGNWSYGAASNGQEVHLNTRYNAAGQFSDGQCWKYTFDSDYTYDVLFHEGATPSESYVQITRTNMPDFYFVSPEVTGGKMLKRYKLTASRHRTYGETEGGITPDGRLDKRYYNLNFKDDELPSTISDGTEIHWYIVSSDGRFYYRPNTYTAADYPLGFSDLVAYSGQNNNVKYENYDKCLTDDSSNPWCYKFWKGERKSYTILLDALGSVVMNSNCSLEDKKEYYLIGNFSDATGGIQLNPSQEKYRKAMTPYWYGHETDGTIREFDSESSFNSSGLALDSLVYKVTVQKPEKGWGDLYLLVAPKSLVNDWPSGDGQEWINHWAQVIRPQIHEGRALDGRALKGGLIEENYSTTSNQSLNPETSDVYKSYTFSMNVTTSTYRIEFNTNIYIIGYGVTTPDGTKGGRFDIYPDKPEWDCRILLTYDPEEGCYKYGTDGLLHLESGADFLFIVNGDNGYDFKYQWNEDDNAPDNDEYRIVNGDTQYKNNVKYFDGDGDDPNNYQDTFGNNIVFWLPTGDYVLRFYDNEGTGKPSYYTVSRYINLRDYNDVYYAPNNQKRTVEGRGVYNYFTTWSDQIAYNIPEDVDVFVVSDFTPATAESAAVAQLKKLTGYIPAEVGVILASKSIAANRPSGSSIISRDLEGNETSFNLLRLELTQYENPEATYDGPSKLTPCYEPTDLPQTVEHEDEEYNFHNYANYLFGFFWKKMVVPTETDEDKYLMGLWLSSGESETYPNSAYLHLNIDDANAFTVGTSYDLSTIASVKPGLVFSFEDAEEVQLVDDKQKAADDPQETTAIRTIANRKTNDNAYYTLQGQRVERPATRGIYIRNGKKVIIK